MKVLWVNEKADFVGNCETYIHDTALLLQKSGVTSYLLYDADNFVGHAFQKAFSGIFPMVAISEQIAAINPDIVYIHCWSNTAIISEILASGVPAVQFFHDHRFFCLHEHKYFTFNHHTCSNRIGRQCYFCLGWIGSIRRWLGSKRVPVAKLLAEQRVVRRLAGYIVGSNYMAEHLALHAFPRSRIHRMPMFVEARSVPPLEASARNNGRILTVGWLNHDQGIDTLLQALCLSRCGWALDIVGTGPMANEYARLAAAYGIGEKVHFCGPKTAEELADLYRNASLVVFPNRAPEAYGVRGPQVMSHGTPVIATSIGAYQEWLLPEVTGIAVPANDPQLLADAIDRLAADSSLRERLGRAAQHHVQENFRSETHRQKLLQLFTGLRANHG